MIENIDDDLFSNDVTFVNEDSNYVIFLAMKLIFLVWILIKVTLLWLDALA